jgi:beta-aspartyl-peptidase (threonine type)
LGPVGVIALDRFGNIACGNSYAGKVGRPEGILENQIGTRLYVDNEIAGVSCTGSNESINHHLCHDSLKRMEYLGEDVQSACKFVLNNLMEQQGISAGLIALNKSGRVAIAFSTDHMPWAYQKDDKIVYGINHLGQFEENLKA